MTLGRLRRAIAITMPGIVLSQPDMPTNASRRCPRTTSSTESAIVSRLTSEAFIPSVPIAIPSVTEIVLNSMGVPPAARMPSFTFSASFWWFQLHGVISLQQWPTPTSGFLRSSSVKPTALKKDRAAARSGPSTTILLLRRGSLGMAILLGNGTKVGSCALWSWIMSSELPDPVLRLGDRRATVHHSPGELEHRVAVAGLVLEALREAAIPDVLEHFAEALCHGFAVHLERAHDPPEHGRRPVVLRGSEEALLPERLEHRLHLTRHVHLQDQRLARHTGVPRDLEGHHNRHAEDRTDRLLDKEVGRGLHLRRHLHRARAQHAEPLGEPQHALLSPPAAIGLHPYAGPEPLALEIAGSRGRARHAWGHQQHVDRGGRLDQVEGQAVA